MCPNPSIGVDRGTKVTVSCGRGRKIKRPGEITKDVDVRARAHAFTYESYLGRLCAVYQNFNVILMNHTGNAHITNMLKNGRLLLSVRKVYAMCLSSDSFNLVKVEKSEKSNKLCPLSSF